MFLVSKPEQSGEEVSRVEAYAVEELVARADAW